MTQCSMDWTLHSSMVLRVLQDSKYLENRGVSFTKRVNTIHRHGGWQYSPSEINSFDDALSVLRDNGDAGGPHFQAICILQGVSYHRILDKGKELLSKLAN